MKKRKKNKEDYFSKFTQYIQSKDELKLQEKEYYLEKYTIFQNVMEIMPCAMYLLDYRQQIHIFISDEIQDLIRERKQQYLISSEKVSFLARREFQQKMYSNLFVYKPQIKLSHPRSRPQWCERLQCLSHVK